MDNYNNRVASTVAHAALGGALGYYSPQMHSLYGLFAVFMAAAFVLIGAFQIVKAIFKNKEFAWWMGNGIWAFVTMWFAVWVFFLNA